MKEVKTTYPNKTIAEQKNKKLIEATELFMRIPPQAQDMIIVLVKSLLSDK